MHEFPRTIACTGLVLLLSAGCAQRVPPAPADTRAATPADARAAVMAADQTWAAAASRGDVDAAADALAPDGIMFPPGAPPVVGREAARAHMRQALAIPGFSITWQTDTVVVAESGELAYAIGRSRYTFPDSAGGIDTVHAKAVSVWRLEPDGKWRAVLDIWNESPALPPILPTAAEPSTPAAATAATAPEAEIRAAEDAWARGIIETDTVALTRLLAAEFVLVGPEAGRPPFPRAAWMTNVASKRVYTDSVSITDFRVTGTADSAVATMLYFWRPIVEGRRMPVDPTRLEDTWVRRDGRWQVVLRRRLDPAPRR